MRSSPLLLMAAALAAGPKPAVFVEHVIAADLKGGYQVVAADMNKDGKPDLIALASGMKELVWYQNPGWQRHVIAGDFNRMINLAAFDIDGDGIPEIVLAHEFANQARNSVGIVSLLKYQGAQLDTWKATEIDRIPTSHRLRWADIHGNGRKVLVNAPLAGARAAPPDYRDRTPLVIYSPEAWIRRNLPEENEGVVHGIYIYDWDGDGREDILTASFQGIHLFRQGPDGQWTKTQLAQGDPAPWPKSGSSDLAVGRLRKARYIAAIEPWHGHQVAVYRERRNVWQRQVIDSSLDSAHTILTADLNGDGDDEVIAGFRGKGRGVYLYYAADKKGERWTRQVLDNGGMAASACTAVDLNGDGRIDIACIGSATANLKWYENRAR
ncbi:MAG: VCBS repeat-containing protein [Acidobacteria bacterium]|nr:VCBS repeat-containing protein [Acidobacteriota bacterium]